MIIIIKERNGKVTENGTHYGSTRTAIPVTATKAPAISKFWGSEINVVTGTTKKEIGHV